VSGSSSLKGGRVGDFDVGQCGQLGVSGLRVDLLDLTAVA
jgi:hypothetical protein